MFHNSTNELKPLATNIARIQQDLGTSLLQEIDGKMVYFK